MELLIGLAVGIGAACVAASVSRSKDRDVGGWTVLSFLFPPLLLVLLILPAANRRTCPMCAEAVHKRAAICKHCGTELVPEGAAGWKQSWRNVGARRQ